MIFAPVAALPFELVDAAAQDRDFGQAMRGYFSQVIMPVVI